MGSNKTFYPLNDEEVVLLKNVSNVRTWLPLEDTKGSEAKEQIEDSSSLKIKKKRKVKKGVLKQKPGSSKDVTGLRTHRNLDYFDYVPIRVAVEPNQESLTPEKERNCVSLDHPRRSFNYVTETVLHVPSLNIEGDTRPRPASQSPSQILPYVQSETLVALQAPKTGIRLEESSSTSDTNKVPKLHQNVPYDPRHLQEELHILNDSFFVYDKKGCLYAIPLRTKRRSSVKPVSMLTVKKVPNDSATNTTVCAAPTTKGAQKTLANVKLDLGFPVGIELGSFGISDEQFPEKLRGKQGFACCLLAFAWTYIKPERSWNVKVLDTIIKDGTELYERNSDKIYQLRIGEADIELHHSTPSVQGKLKSEDLDIYRGLKQCLKKGQKCVFRCRKLTLLIWKKYGYFIYDPLGRTMDCTPGTQSALITVKSLENVAHIIVNLSKLQGNPSYTLTHITITKLESPAKHKGKRNVVTGAGYHTLNKYRAILRCEYHLRHTNFKATVNMQSMPMSVTSLIFTKIYQPSTWTVAHLHKIMIIGGDLYKKWSKNKDAPLDLKDLPKTFQIGKYAVSLKLQPFRAAVPIRETSKEVSEVLKSILVQHHLVLIQVSHMFLAAWMKNQIYYLFDPYPRDEEGEICIDKYGQCCVNMFSLIDELSQHFWKNMLQLQPGQQMYVHVIDIEKLWEVPSDEEVIDSEPLIQLVEDADDDANKEEVKSVVDPPEVEVAGAEKLEVKDKEKEKVQDKKKVRDKEEVQDKEKVLVLDSPYTSLTLIHEDVLQPSREVDPSDISISGEQEAQHVISPSIDYLCAAETYKLIGDVTDALPLDPSPPCIDDEARTSILMCSNVKPLIARKILLKSDLQRLKEEKKRIKRESVGLPHEHCPCRDPILSLSQELLIVSNFKQMPDRSGIIFGTKHLLNTKDDVTDKDLEYLLPVSAIAAIVCSYKYSIGTWDANVVDFVLDIAREMMGVVNQTSNAPFFSTANHNFPLMEVGSKRYQIRMEMVKIVPFKSLYRALETLFLQIPKVAILSPISSIAVFKRKNFYYLFEPYPCNPVGLRTVNGSACFMRFLTLTDMIRRLEANRKELKANHEVILSQILLSEVSEDLDPYPHPTTSQKEEMMRDAKLEQVYRDYKKQQKVDEISARIEEERKRVKGFRKCKRISGTHEPSLVSVQSSESQQLTNSTQRSSTAKTPSNKKYKPMMKYESAPSIPKPSMGYHQCEQDHLWKIQGSIALQNRCETVNNRVKRCHFASMYALMYVMHQPIEKWDHRKVDLCIENGKTLYDQVENPEVCLTREIDNLLIDNKVYHIVITSCTNNHNQTVPLSKTLISNFHRHRYLILQFSNCSFGLYKDQFYHVFDPYPNLECCEKVEKVRKDSALETVQEPVATLTETSPEVMLEPEATVPLESVPDVEASSNRVSDVTEAPLSVPQENNEPIEEPLENDEPIEGESEERLTAGGSISEVSNGADDVESDGKSATEQVALPSIKELNEDGTQSTASWILCTDIDDILNYISNRVTSLDLDTNYTLYRINILNYKKAPKESKLNYLLYKPMSDSGSQDMTCRCNVEPKLVDETIELLEKVGIPPWSRLEKFNVENKRRGTPQTTLKSYDVEISKDMYSLWSDISPNSPIFRKNLGKQYLAINSIAIAMTLLYPLDEWNSEILNSTIIHGDKYFEECIETISNPRHEFDFSDLNEEYELDEISLHLTHKPILYGTFYDRNPQSFNLSRALTFFFREHTYGILSMAGRAVAIGREKTFFMFDCQSMGSPLFMKDQGAAYVLRCCSLRRLLECLLVTFNVNKYGVRFVLYAVEVGIGEEQEPRGSVSEAATAPITGESQDKLNTETKTESAPTGLKSSDDQIQPARISEVKDDETGENDGNTTTEEAAALPTLVSITQEVARVPEANIDEEEETRLSTPYVPMIDPRT